MPSTNSKQSAGYFREKAIIGLSTLTGDEVDKAILKVTSHMLKAPKEKYMQSLLAASFGHTRQYQKNGYPINEYIVRELEKRSHTHNWIVVLKTMVVLHRLLSDGSDDMGAVIHRYRSMFSVQNIKELGDTASGAAQKFFIVEYMRYLEERAISQGVLGFNRRIETKEFDDYMNGLNAAECVQPFNAMLRMLEALLHIAYRESIVDNFCTMEAHLNIIRDGKQIFQLLSKRVVFVLNGFEDLSLSLKQMWLLLYRRYSVAAGKLKTLFDTMARSSRAFVEPIPQLNPLPDSLLARLERSVESSEKPEVESLASLGIKSEDPRTVKEERLPPPPPSQPRREEATSPVPAVAKEPAKPAFTMDDLFQPGPVSQSIAPTQMAPPPFTSGSDDGWSTGAPAPVPTDWSTGAPGAGWATGAPPEAMAQQPGSQPYSGFQAPEQQGFGYYGGGDTSQQKEQNEQWQMQQPASQWQQQEQPPTQQHSRAQDPFKDIYNQTQQRWE